MSISPRDIFILELFEIAKDDKDIFLLTCDMGAPSLDKWRTDLPGQYINCGISEQHTINFAAGLANSGKKVYVYFMGCWAARCFEQIRYSCCMANNPITILGTAVGLSYAPAGPAHAPTEDLAYMRSLLNIEIYTPCNNNEVKELVKLSYNENTLKYIRLERTFAPECLNIITNMKHGILKVYGNQPNNTCIISCGYVLGRCILAAKKLSQSKYPVNVLNLWKIKPIDTKVKKIVSSYINIVTVEEQTLSGGLGSVVCEIKADLKLSTQITRLGLPEKYLFENGTRDNLIDKYLSTDLIYNTVINTMSK